MITLSSALLPGLRNINFHVLLKTPYCGSSFHNVQPELSCMPPDSNQVPCHGTLLRAANVLFLAWATDRPIISEGNPHSPHTSSRNHAGRTSISTLACTALSTFSKYPHAISPASRYICRSEGVTEKHYPKFDIALQWDFFQISSAVKWIALRHGFCKLRKSSFFSRKSTTQIPSCSCILTSKISSVNPERSIILFCYSKSSVFCQNEVDLDFSRDNIDEIPSLWVPNQMLQYHLSRLNIFTISI